MQSNELINAASQLIQSSINGISTIFSFETDGRSFNSQKTLAEILVLSQMEVEQEISIANTITEKTITLINNHESAVTRGYLFNVLKEEYISSIENREPAILPFMKYMKSLYKISEAENLPDEKGMGGYLFTPTQWERYLYTGNASGILYAIYDDDLINEAAKAISVELSADQINYLYYYLAYIAYQIAFSSFISMELIENLTGLNFGFEQNNRLVKNIAAQRKTTE